MAKVISLAAGALSSPGGGEFGAPDTGFSRRGRADDHFGNFPQLPRRDPTPLQERVDRIRGLLDQDPDNQMSLLGLGRGLIDLRRPAEAVEPLRHAVELQPEHAAAHRDLGRSLL